MAAKILSLRCLRPTPPISAPSAAPVGFTAKRKISLVIIGPGTPFSREIALSRNRLQSAMDKYEFAILGLGAMGSAATYQLAKRGAKVLGLDQFAPPHVLGSSHGDTRITRLAIGEGAHYTPLDRKSHEIWRDIENETGADLLMVTGGLIISSANRTAMLHVDD